MLCIPSAPGASKVQILLYNTGTPCSTLYSRADRASMRLSPPECCDSTCVMMQVLRLHGATLSISLTWLYGVQFWSTVPGIYISLSTAFMPCSKKGKWMQCYVCMASTDGVCGATPHRQPSGACRMLGTMMWETTSPQISSS